MLTTDSQVQTIHDLLTSAKDMYHQLVLIVGPSGSGKTELLKQVAEEVKTSVINVNLEISSRLLELTGKQRKTKLLTVFNDIVDHAQSPVILDNLEILLIWSSSRTRFAYCNMPQEIISSSLLGMEHSRTRN